MPADTFFKRKGDDKWNIEETNYFFLNFYQTMILYRHYLIPDPSHLVHVMGHHQEGAIRLETNKEFLYNSGGLRVERAGRFIA